MKKLLLLIALFFIGTNVYAAQLVTPANLVQAAGSVRNQAMGDTGNGTGGTGGYTRIFTNLSNAGTAISCATTAGTVCTINATGIYAVTYTEDYGSAVCQFCISVNATGKCVVNAAASVGNNAGRLAVDSIDSNSVDGNASWTGLLNATDIVRFQTGNVNCNGTTNGTQFTITKIGN